MHLELAEQKAKIMVEKITLLETKVKESARMFITVTNEMTDKLDTLKNSLKNTQGKPKYF